MSRLLNTITFATSTPQSMWSPGATSLTQYSDKPFYLVGPTSVGPINLNESLGGVSVAATASATFDLKAVLTASTGSVSLSKYSAIAAFDVPDAVTPGQTFTVKTSAAGAGPVDLSAVFPGITFSLVADVNASFSGSLTTPFGGTQSLNPAPLNVAQTLYSLAPDASPYETKAGPFKFKLAWPAPFQSESKKVDPGTGGLPSVTATGQSGDVVNVSADVLKLLAPLLSLPPPLPSYDLEFGGAKFGSINLASLVLSGGIKIAQKFVFQPTAIDVTVDPGFDPGVDAQTGKLGDSFTFSVPGNWSGPVQLQTSYALEGNLISDTGIIGHLDAAFSAGKIKIEYSKDKTLVDLGPVFSTKTSYAGPPLYLINPGSGPGTPNNSFKFGDGYFNTVKQTYTIPEATTATAVPAPTPTWTFFGGDLSDPNNWGKQPDPNNPQVPTGQVVTIASNPTGGSATVLAVIPGGATVSLAGTLTGSLYVAGNLTLGAGGTLSAGIDVENGGTFTLAAGGVIGDSLDQETEIIGDASQGQFVQSGGTNFAGVDVGNQNIGAPPNGQGIYELDGGSLTGSLQVARDGRGTFNQNGGDFTGLLVIGGASDGIGTYNLNGGTFHAGPSGFPTATIGNQGTGEFIQNGGSASISGELFIGQEGGDGTYTLHHGDASIGTLDIGGDEGVGDIGNGVFNLDTQSGDDGTLTVRSVFVGDLGNGNFNQGGGTLTLTGALSIAENAFSDAPSEGTYELDGGTLAANSANGGETVGVEGYGFFIQKGGSNTVSDTTFTINNLDQPFDDRGLVLAVSTNLSAYGSYELDAGSLWVDANEVVGMGGEGAFVQNGGTNSTGNLVVGQFGLKGGSYTLNGGSLAAGYDYIGYDSPGSFIQTAGSNTVGHVGTSIISGTVLVLGYDKISTGSNGDYVLGGTGNLTVTGDAIVGRGGDGSSFEFNTSAGDAATLQILGSNGLTVGYSAKNSSFIQGAGNLSLAGLDLGTTFSGEGEYELDGDPQKDSLSVTGSEIIGDQGTGTFAQEGAANNTSQLIVGNGATASGLYLFDAGTLTAGAELIGTNGTGEFDQVSGTDTVNGDLLIGTPFMGTGTYALGGNGALDVTGAVTVDNGTFEFNPDPGDAGTFAPGAHLVVVGSTPNGNATFIQGGGDLSTSVQLGLNAGSVGTFQFTDGTLTAGDATSGGGSVQVGVAGTGTFTQTGLSNTIHGFLSVGVSALSTGTYELDAGSVFADTETIGEAGTGTFNQTSGENDAGAATIGKLGGANGTYALSGDGVFHVTGDFTVAAQANAIGAVNQTGGTLKVDGDIHVAEPSNATGAISVTSGSAAANQLILGAGGTAIAGSGGVITAQTIRLNGGTIDALGGGTLGNGSVDVGTDASDIAASVHVGADGAFSGFGLLNGNLVDDGDVLATSGSLILTGALTGNNTAKIDNGAQLSIGGLDSANVQFQGGIGTMLRLVLPSEFTGMINGLALGDTIDLVNKKVTDATINVQSDGSVALNVTTNNVEKFSFIINGDVGANRRFDIHDDGAGGSNLVLAQTSLSGQIVPTTIAEAATTIGTVATFSDTNTTDTASNFTAAIDWGDGTNEAATVTGQNGSFTVAAPGTNHVYIDETTVHPVVTITRTTDNNQIALTGTVTITEDDSLTPTGTTINVTQGQSFNGVVATFNDTNSTSIATDFTATIDWGDGTASTGTVTGGSGALTVSGDHIYAAPGTDTVTVALADDAPGSATATAETTADVTPCYCAGTLILTDHGEVPVETLAIGDLVVTANGAARPIRWIGRRSYAGRFARGTHVLPICFKAKSLDADQPRRDLWVSPHHAMFLGGVLIEALDLVNGVSITQAERVERVDYFHIELDTHDVIVAEGALSESFVDDDSRGMFQNAHEFRALYPNERPRPDPYCAPRLAFGPQVEAARRQIAQRAGIPHARPVVAQRPRALVIDSKFPEVGHDGGSNAILDHMRALQSAGFEVSFLSLRHNGTNTRALSSLGVTPLSLPRNGRVSEVMRAHAGQFDLVYLHRVDSAMYCLKLARQYFDAQIIYSVADLHHVRLKAQSQFDQDHASELMQQAHSFAIREVVAALSADCVITHSATEADQLQQISSLKGENKIRVVPWTVPVAPVRRPLADRSGLAFIGGFAHAPNVDGAQWLVNDVMPLVWQDAPDIICLLIGSDLSEDLRRKLQRPGVDVLGRVDSLADIFERIRLTVAPLRFGLASRTRSFAAWGRDCPASVRRRRSPGCRNSLPRY